MSIPSLYYYKDGTTEITLYVTDSTSWEQALAVRADDTTYYARMDSNLSHPYASNLRIRLNDVTYAILIEDSD
jgi:hypothetical protein